MGLGDKTLARHHLERRGAHVIARLDEHVTTPEKAVLASAGDTASPCRREKRIPPSAQALAKADQITPPSRAGPWPPNRHRWSTSPPTPRPAARSAR